MSFANTRFDLQQHLSDMIKKEEEKQEDYLEQQAASKFRRGKGKKVKRKQARTVNSLGL